jgi:hypothetical protein
MTEEIHDHSRVDAFMVARRRAMVLHAVWRPMLAGAAGAALVIGCVWVTLPKISYREIEVPRVTMRDVPVPNIIPHDVQVDHVVPHDVPIDIPRIVVTTPAPTPITPEERRFVGTEGWRDAVIRGRILREDRNGFVLLTDEGEKPFYPAKIGADGKIEVDASVKDGVAPFIDNLGYCQPLPVGTYECRALHDGREVVIPQVPVGAPL